MLKVPVIYEELWSLYTQDWAANYWVNNGLPKAKLNIGLPTYGRHFELSKVRQNAIGSRIKRAGTKGPYTKEDGFLAYFEVSKIF